MKQKQKEIKKEKGCGYWDIAAFGTSIFLFKSVFIKIKRGTDKSKQAV